MDFVGHGRQQSAALSKRSISTSFLERRLGSLSISRRGSESSEQIKGPLGLNLLWEPSEPRIEFIFVHGLRGGSRKTWSQSDDPAHYWLKEWLPSEPGFRHVRIHSYGYNADWGEKVASVVNIHDFGQALLGDIYNSHLIGRDANTAIVLVGHSMGGLVIKKAYLLAKQDPNNHTLGARFHSMFFLATPHRGADSAQLLNNILRLSMSHDSKAYIDDLVPNSGALQVINDEFRHAYQGSHIWSFFETLKTNLVMSQELIVEKDSAAIGLPSERIQLLNADHQHMCKFMDPTDNNYITLRNAFVSTIDFIENSWSTSKRDERRGQMKLLSQFLGVSERPEGNLSSLIEKQMEGTCQWLVDRPGFRKWQEGAYEAPKHLWLSAKPATGKSTASGHVIRFLEDCNSDCSFYFFKRGEKGSSSIPHLLRSLAFQMASSNLRVRETLLEMQQDAVTFSVDDEHTIWRTMFAARILRVKLSQPHYWIIDALDECHNHGNIISMLGRIDKNYPLRVFMTSRLSPSVERLFLQENLPVLAEQITLSDSRKDIQLFLEAKSTFLPVDNEIACNELVQAILDKSNGCFLWASLVLKELESAHSRQQIWEVLQEVPTGMDDLYTRILDGMMNLSREKELAKAIIRWTVCATRPLTTEELKEALKLDIGETLSRVEKSVGSICGNLIQVDNQSRVKMVHQTAMAFLTKEGLRSEFAIDKVKENSRLAEVCLKYLVGDEMRSPRNRKGSAYTRLKERSPFVEYASLYFSEHVARSSSSTDTHFMLLETFVNTTILAWIEYIARSGDLYYLTHAAKNLNAFLERRAKYRSPLGQAVYTVSSWANDLIHLVAAFGESILASPASIYSLVPPLCPPQSMLYKTFGNHQPCLKVAGSSDQDWDDRLSCIVFSEERTTSIACQGVRFAIGLANGSIVLCYTSTLQEEKILHHGEPVRKLRFANVGPFLASSGRRNIKLWDVATGAQLWIADHRHSILTLEFNEDDKLLLAATGANQIAYWVVSDSKELDTCPIHETIQEDQSEYRPPATHAHFSLGLGLLAIAHRQRPISFWDLEAKSFVGQFYVSGTNRYPGPLIVALVFNPNPDVSLLAASYQEEYLVILDPWTQEQQALVRTRAHVLAASSDGKTLAAGDGSGTIQLFDFETLRLMYSVTASDYNVSAIIFADNNLRFFDIRNDHCNIWEPPVLVRQVDSGETQSESVSTLIPSGPELAGASVWDGDLTITAIFHRKQGEILFCGRRDGSVVLLDSKTGKLLQKLYNHARNVAVSWICWNEKERILVSTDMSGRTVARTMLKALPGKCAVDEPLMDVRLSQVIHQVLISPDGKRLLFSTSVTDELRSIAGQLLRSRGVLQPATRIRITHPTDPNYLLFVDGSVARLFKWDTFDELTSPSGIILENFFDDDSLSTEAVSCYAGRNVCATFSNPRRVRVTSHLRLWPTSSLTLGGDSAKPIASYGQLAAKIKTVIGIHKSSLLFLTNNGWVCSINIESERPEKSYTKHFFIPYGWHSGAEPILDVTASGSIILIRKHEVLVFQRGLSFEEKMDLE